MDVRAAQMDLDRDYLGGAPGVLVSGLVWLAAGAAETLVSVERGIMVLLIGGVLIYPLSTLLCRYAFRADPPDPNNPLGVLGFESTVPLFAGVFITYTLLLVRPYLAFPLLSIIIGARYFSFATLYANQFYWVVGGALFGLGVFATIAPASIPVSVAYIVGGAEVVFAALIILTRMEITKDA